MGVLTAGDAIRMYLTGKKTPYQLDLEVKDRRPDITPKVGDKVKIKSKEWYDKWKDLDGEVNLAIFFSKWAAKWCGTILTVTCVDRDGTFKTSESGYCWFSLDAVEEVYPKEPDIVSITPTMILSKEQRETLLKQMDSFIWMKNPIAQNFLVNSIHSLTETQQKQKLKFIHSRPLLKLKKL